MKCPFCEHEDSQVKDSRPFDSGYTIKRRRSCPSCNGRFTTFERIEQKDIIVQKRNGHKRPFDSSKLSKSIQLALRKRDVSEATISKIVSKLMQQIQAMDDPEIPSKIIGGLVMDELSQVDEVAYIRYASVYYDFSKVDDFSKFITGAEKIQTQNDDNKPKSS